VRDLADPKAEAAPGEDDEHRFEVPRRLQEFRPA